MRKKHRRKNTILAIVQQNDPERYRERIVKPEKGKGRKDRPRNYSVDDFFDCAA